MIKLIIFMSFFLFQHARADPGGGLTREFRRIANYTSTASMVGYEKGKDNITFVGLINAGAVLNFKEKFINNNDIKYVYIDSQGGDGEAAIDMAEFIARHDLTLVVDGLCGSACAQVLFVAAKKKMVLPESVVLVHAPAVHVNYGDGRGWVDVSESEAINNRQKIPDAYYQRLLLTLEHDKKFYENHRIKGRLISSYETYLKNRDMVRSANWKTFSSIWNNCPEYGAWALDRHQLASMGVTGMGDFWFPATEKEKKRIDLKLAQLSIAIYYGSGERLENLCKNPIGVVYDAVMTLSAH